MTQLRDDPTSSDLSLPLDRRGYEISQGRKPHVLMIEDDRSLSDIVSSWLARENYALTCVSSAEDAVQILDGESFDAIILDWVLPGLNGIEFLRSYRARNGKAPVMILTSKSRIEEKEQGFASGCDDYLIKPFELRELSVRLGALLRRTGESREEVLSAGEIQMNVITYEVKVANREVHLMPKEFMLLEVLLRNPGKVFSNSELIRQLCDPESQTSEDAIRTHVKRLRKKLEIPGKPSCIITIHGVGYKLQS